MYSAQLLDHFQNPRNPGEISNADAVSEIENPACGDAFIVNPNPDLEATARQPNWTIYFPGGSLRQR